MKIKCLIVDDEPLARGLIRNHIEKLGNFEVIGECCNAMEAFQSLRNQSTDLVFLDIQMPQITGIDFLKTIKHPPKVILTTGYSEYALEGFDLEVVDFLLKPISFERFLKAVNKFYAEVTDQPVFSQPISTSNGYEEAYIYVKENKKAVKVFLGEILYVEGLSEYVQIFTDKKKIITKASMSHMEEKLPNSRFLRIHKSYIVSVKKIEAFTTTNIELPGKELPIGRSYKSTVLDSLSFKGMLAE
jgi:DNA-binding LytR/AlgR family response regulator